MTILTLPSGLWTLEFTVPAGTPDGVLLLLTDSLSRSVRAEKTGSALTIRLDTRWPDAPSCRKQAYTFELKAPLGGSSIQLMWLDAAIRLYADGKLIDEEWPLGTPAQGECTLSGLIPAGDVSVRALFSAPALESTPMQGPAQFYRPPYHNATVGDCMPFVHDGIYRLYHLFDRRQHGSKAGLGAHQWANISSRDLKTWTLHPIAIGIDEQWEGSICTGSMIECGGLIYAFYAARMSDGTPARLTWAVSEDGISFRKSGSYFSLTDPYEPVSARDPKVFLGADGQYHMLVTTSLLTAEGKPGCLAHLTSPDLLSWTQLDPMYVPGGGDQPECSDYFEWNGLYYLVYATGLTAHYRISRQPFGPWTQPEDDILVASRICVPKTACLNGRRLVSGWVRLNGRWGGYAVTYELIQRGDGTLGVKSIPELEDGLVRPVFTASADADGCEILSSRADSSFRLTGTLASAAHLTLRFGEGAEYRLVFDGQQLSFLRPDLPEETISLPAAEMPLTIDLTLCGCDLLLLLPDGRLFMPAPLMHSGPCEIRISGKKGCFLPG